MDKVDSMLSRIGYVKQTTPAGRTIWSNPKYLMTAEELEREDDYYEEYEEAYNAEQRAIDEDLGYEECGQPHSDDIDWGMTSYDDRFELED